MVYPHVQYQGPAYPDRQQSTTTANPPANPPANPRELDSRISDGIEVRLLWHPVDDRTSVAVHDTTTGEMFELKVADGQRAIDVFRHPYAYAA